MSLLLALGLAGALVQPAAAPQGGAIAGRILDAETRAPIAGAEVTLLPIPPRRSAPFLPDQLRTVLTDHSGRYEFDNLDPGRYRISVQKAGFARAGSETPEINLGTGERREAVNVMLQKGAVIVGRVLDEAGEPLMDAQVMAMQRPGAVRGAPSGPPDMLLPGPGTQTNDVGEFRIFGLPPGEYCLQAVVQPEFGRSVQRARTMVPTYFPGTADPAAAQPIRVAAGETFADVVIRMIGAPAYEVSGLVRDEAGRPVANALVKLEDSEPDEQLMFAGFGRQARTDASGRFVIHNVTNGAYTLLAIAPLVISRQEPRAGGVSGSMTSGMVIGPARRGGAVMTETRDGTTVEYRDDRATRVPITVSDGNVADLEVVVPAKR